MDKLIIKYFPAIFVVTFSLIFCIVIWDQFSMRRTLLDSMTLENANTYIKTVETFRNVYSKEVVSQVKHHNVPISHNYKEIPGAIPLPATFAMELGKGISLTNTGVKIRLYSEYPFPWRQDGGPTSVFEQTAITHLNQNPNQPYYEFSDIEGIYTLKYASADIMLQNCIDCHNSHPQSPKRDWKVGDVRGALVVQIPIKAGNFQRASFFKEKIALIGVIGILGLILGLTFIRRINITTKTKND